MNTPSPRVALIAAEFNRPLVDAMVEVARNELSAAGATLLHVVRVPGCYETPLVADRLLTQKSVDALVVLGYIERGETLHGEVMGQVVHAALVQLQLNHWKPIGLGIIGPGATAEQAEARKVSSARAAVHAALRCREVLSSLTIPPETPAP